MDVKFYKKKPVVIKAVRVKKNNLYLAADWCNGRVLEGPTADMGPYGVLITTLEGDMGADIGDFIIKGIKGEFYPCKPDIFDLTYEPIERHEQ